MLLERLSAREKAIAAGTAAVIILAFFYAFIWEPLTGKWKHLNRQIVTETAKLNKNIKIIENENFITNEYKQYEDYVQVWGSDEEVVAFLLKTIEQKARQSSVHITNIKPRAPKVESQYKMFVFEVISESDLDNLLKFIYELHNSDELLKVNRLTIGLKSGRENTLRGIMEITKIALIDFN